MKYSQARQGRVFVIRLEDGDVIHTEIEKFAAAQGIRAAVMTILGGADKGSRLVVGPEHGRGDPVMPMEHELDEAHEAVGTGTLFPNQKGEPMLHMHIACGRKDGTATGCVRKGVRAWHVLEVILIELLDTSAQRALDPALGFELLQP